MAAPPRRHWRESYFFAAHQPDGTGDVLVFTMASHPSTAVLDSYQMGRVDGLPYFTRYHRRYQDDPRTTVVGPVSATILEPYRRIRLRAAPGRCPVGVDLTWTARTRPYLMRRGTLRVGDALVWDQRQLVQSGWFDGEYSANGRTIPVRRWWGQRDHSWGVRDHARCPMWLWLAIQLPDGMAGAWCWERSDASRVYTDGCWAPGNGGPSVPIATLAHDLMWTSGGSGLAGRVVIHLAGGDRIGVSAEGELVVAYGRRGGGLYQMRVRTDDGRTGTAVYELTGSRHRRYFPGGGAGSA